MAENQRPEESVPGLVHNLGNELRQLVTDEVSVAKAELRQTLKRTITALIGLLVAGFGALLVVLFALVTLVEWLPNHTFVAGMIGIAGIVLMLLGGLVIWVNRRLIPISRIVAGFKEDLEWAKRQTRRVKP